MLATPDIKKKTRKLCQQKEWTEGCSTGRAEAEAGGTQSLSPLQTSVTHDTGTKGDAPCPTSKWGGGLSHPSCALASSPFQTAARPWGAQGTMGTFLTGREWKIA